jgi:hypothetical protein
MSALRHAVCVRRLMDSSSVHLLDMFHYVRPFGHSSPRMRRLHAGIRRIRTQRDRCLQLGPRDSVSDVRFPGVSVSATSLSLSVTVSPSTLPVELHRPHAVHYLQFVFAIARRFPPLCRGSQARAGRLDPQLTATWARETGDRKGDSSINHTVTGSSVCRPFAHNNRSQRPTSVSLFHEWRRLPAVRESGASFAGGALLLFYAPRLPHPISPSSATSSPSPTSIFHFNWCPSVRDGSFFFRRRPTDPSAGIVTRDAFIGCDVDDGNRTQPASQRRAAANNATPSSVFRERRRIEAAA